MLVTGLINTAILLIYECFSDLRKGQKPTGELTFTKVRNNKDFLETTLEIDGEVKLRKCYVKIQEYFFFENSLFTLQKLK